VGDLVIEKKQDPGLGVFFNNYIKKQAFFKNKDALQTAYTPDKIPHRDNEINQIANILAPALKSERPSNVFVYGKTGTGKTVSAQYVLNYLLTTASQNGISLGGIYVNCKLKKVADTEYRLIAHLAEKCGRKLPPTGLPTDEIYKAFFNVVDDAGRIMILVLDEIDQLVKKTGDGILYTLSRMNEELKHSKISIIGISNDLTFIDHVDPRVKSSLSEEEILFPPYNALQIKDILDERAQVAFSEGVLSEGVTAKCAAYAAMEHGDARRALELLRVAAELAERNNQEKVQIQNVDEAENKIDRDKIFEAVSTQPTQMQAALYAILMINEQKKNQLIFTGEVYELYKEICGKIGLRPLTQRRVSDIVSELDMLGVISAKVISKGRYGRTREIRISIPFETAYRLKETLTTALQIG
jgi:archaeal cell division control protein 6